MGIERKKEEKKREDICNQRFALYENHQFLLIRKNLVRNRFAFYGINARPISISNAFALINQTYRQGNQDNFDGFFSFNGNARNRQSNSIDSIKLVG